MSERGSQQRLDGYEARTSVAMLLLSFLYIALYAVQVLVVDPTSDEATWLLVASNVIWATFIIDLAIRTYLAPRPGQYLLRHPLDVLAVVLPAFRSLRVLRVITAGDWLVTRGSKPAIGRSATALTVAVLLLALVGALAVLSAERGAPGANIENFGSAVWWAFSTMSTVGYGDVYPVTFQGRVVAVAMMVVGVAILGLVSGSLATMLMRRLRGGPASDLQQVLAELSALRREIADLQRANASSGGNPTRTDGAQQAPGVVSRGEAPGRGP